MEKDLQLLKEDLHYYGKFGKQFLSNSDIITLLNDPKSFGKEKPMTKAMLVGRYFHTAMLEPEKIDSVEYWTIDASSRNTKVYKEQLLHYKRSLMMLTKEKAEIDKAIETMKTNLEFHDTIYDEDNEFEVPAIHELFGVKWKGKADIVGKEFLIDLKTTSNIKDFKYSPDIGLYFKRIPFIALSTPKPLSSYVLKVSPLPNCS